MLHASTGKSKQADVWSTGLAVYLNILEGEKMEKACRFLADAYKKGYLPINGNIRHVLTIDDFNETTSWEFSLAKKNTYQNGAYWGTPTGWICYAISKADFVLHKNWPMNTLKTCERMISEKAAVQGRPGNVFILRVTGRILST